MPVQSLTSEDIQAAVDGLSGNNWHPVVEAIKDNSLDGRMLAPYMANPEAISNFFKEKLEVEMKPFIADTLHERISAAAGSAVQADQQTVSLAGQADQQTDRQTHSAETLIKVDSAKSANAVATGRDMVIGPKNGASTKVKAEINGGKFDGDVKATATGATVMPNEDLANQAGQLVIDRKKEEAKLETPFQRLATRMAAILRNDYFDVDDENKFVKSTNTAIRAFKNKPIKLSVDQINTIAGLLEDVEVALGRKSQTDKIETLTLLTKALGEIQKAHKK
jgi:hypothetical protein